MIQSNSAYLNRGLVLRIRHVLILLRRLVLVVLDSRLVVIRLGLVVHRQVRAWRRPAAQVANRGLDVLPQLVDELLLLHLHGRLRRLHLLLLQRDVRLLLLLWAGAWRKEFRESRAGSVAKSHTVAFQHSQI
jgi:hypothetical protein